MATRSPHANKEIEAVVAEAEADGWTWKKVKGHAWGQLLCAHHDRDGCRISIWSTPKNAENHARSIRRVINRCPHKEEAKNENV